MALRALLISLGCLAAAPLWADDTAGSRWSFGTQMGQARGKGDPAPIEGDVSTMSYDVSATFGEKDRFGWRVFTGYRFTDYLAVHVGYTDLGEVQSRLADAGALDFRLSDPVGSQTIRGVDVGLQLKVPVGERVAVDMRGGKYYWRSRTHVTNLMREDEISTRRGSDAFYGIGMELAVIDELTATLGWTRYEVAGERVHLWTVGTLFRFSMF